MKKTIFILIISIFLPFTSLASELEIIRGEVTSIKNSESITVKIQNDTFQETIELSTVNLNQETGKKLRKGDFVIIEKYNINENDIKESNYSVVDLARDQAIYALIGLFLFLAIVITGKKGILAMLSLGISFYIIFYFLINSITAGGNPIYISLIAITIIIPINFFITHGFHKKTLAAVLATFITITLTIILSEIFINWARLTGNTSEEAFWVMQDFTKITNTKGLLSAAITIGLVGILDDITINQASIVQELSNSNQKENKKKIHEKAMRIGKDHISSMINTLILVYSSASLPLFILLSEDLGQLKNLINYEMVSEEIIRILIASIGVIIAVPITTIIATRIIHTDSNRGLTNVKKTI